MAKESSFSFEGMRDDDWILPKNTPYMIKMKIKENETTCVFLVSNMICVFGKIVPEEELQKVFKETNPHVKMQTKVILKYMRAKIESLDKNMDGFSITETSDGIVITLCISIKGTDVTLGFSLQRVNIPELQHSFVVSPILSAMYMARENYLLRKHLAECKRILSTAVPPHNVKDFIAKTDEEIKRDVKMKDICMNVINQHTLSTVDKMRCFVDYQSEIMHEVDKKCKQMMESMNTRDQTSNVRKKGFTAKDIYNNLMEISDINHGSMKDTATDKMSTSVASVGLISYDEDITATSSKNQISDIHFPKSPVSEATSTEQDEDSQSVQASGAQPSKSSLSQEMKNNSIIARKKAKDSNEHIIKKKPKLKI